jgi:hypothetical protein
MLYIALILHHDLSRGAPPQSPVQVAESYEDAIRMSEALMRSLEEAGQVRLRTRGTAHRSHCVDTMPVMSINLDCISIKQVSYAACHVLSTTRAEHTVRS